jgi:hypothetical protein
MTCFRTCSSRRSRSQAPLCHCTRRPVSNRAEGTIARLRYSLGGDRPSQTTHQTVFRSRLTGLRLDTRNQQGGISPLPPPNLAARLRRLPPILHSQSLVSLSSCSKGSRGLSVLLRVNCIGTAISISLSPSPRQCGSRYSIRAGRNLPDKEFRYLRTVIVTAAVYWGFGSSLRLAADESP